MFHQSRLDGEDVYRGTRLLSLAFAYTYDLVKLMCCHIAAVLVAPSKPVPAAVPVASKAVYLKKPVYKVKQNPPPPPSHPRLRQGGDGHVDAPVHAYAKKRKCMHTVRLLVRVAFAVLWKLNSYAHRGLHLQFLTSWHVIVCINVTEHAIYMWYMHIHASPGISSNFHDFPSVTREELGLYD